MKLSKNEVKVLEVLQLHMQTTAEIAKTAKIDKRGAWRALNSLEQKHLVHRSFLGGMWSSTTKTKDTLVKYKASKMEEMVLLNGNLHRMTVLGICSRHLTELHPDDVDWVIDNLRKGVDWWKNPYTQHPKVLRVEDEDF